MSRKFFHFRCRFRFLTLSDLSSPPSSLLSLSWFRSFYLSLSLSSLSLSPSSSSSSSSSLLLGSSWIRRLSLPAHTTSASASTVVALRSDPSLVDDSCAPADFYHSHEVKDDDDDDDKMDGEDVGGGGSGVVQAEAGVVGSDGDKNSDCRRRRRKKRQMQCHILPAMVYPNAITEEEGSILVSDILAKMKRRRYEKGHWDAVIAGYREVELPIPSDFIVHRVVADTDANANANELHSHSLSQSSSSSSLFHSPLSDRSIKVIERIRSHLASSHFSSHQNDKSLSTTTTTRTMAKPLVRWMPCHGIDLKENGALNAHVDSVRYSGQIVAGLSLSSCSIMRLKPAPPDEIARSGRKKDEREGGKEKGAKKEYDDDDDDENDGGGGGVDARKGLSDNGVFKEEGKGHIDLYLPPLSLYVLSGSARYRYTHELLPSGATFRMQPSSSTLTTTNGKSFAVNRGRRISIIFRDAK